MLHRRLNAVIFIGIALLLSSTHSAAEPANAAPPTEKDSADTGLPALPESLEDKIALASERNSAIHRMEAARQKAAADVSAAEQRITKEVVQRYQEFLDANRDKVSTMEMKKQGIATQSASQTAESHLVETEANIRYLLGSGAVPSAEPTSVPDTLDGALHAALEHNPELEQARAALALAEAELADARQQVARDVIEMHLRLNDLRALSDELSKQVEVGTAHPSELSKIEAECAELVARTYYVLGMAAGESRDGSGGAAAARPPIPEVYERCLAATVSLNGADSLDNVLRILAEQTQTVIVVGSDVANSGVSIKLSDVSMAQALAALSDQLLGEVCFIFRDYGILAAGRRDAPTIEGASIPPGVPYVRPSSR